MIDKPTPSNCNNLLNKRKVLVINQNLLTRTAAAGSRRAARQISTRSAKRGIIYDGSPRHERSGMKVRGPYRRAHPVSLASKEKRIEEPSG
ncbi:hypothetical protein [Paludibacterium yongneupense]|uniref:hypothetical protein n=1 Tax=Paludibacterium yongneupense TaxID=400061 RepID=UPI00146B7454|nr:hypothetical protein [Paludibacterium yongneupense]